MKKLVPIFVGIVVSVAMLIAILCAWCLWELHPWVPAGQAFALGQWHFGDCEFQVWQRKNSNLAEVFADGLFVCQGTNQWQSFCFDIQDDYSPKVRLQKEDSKVIIYRNGEIRGFYDMTNHTLTFDFSNQKSQRHAIPIAPAYIDGEPPGNWWLK